MSNNILMQRSELLTELTTLLRQSGLFLGPSISNIVNVREPELRPVDPAEPHKQGVNRAITLTNMANKAMGVYLTECVKDPKYRGQLETEAREAGYADLKSYIAYLSFDMAAYMLTELENKLQRFK